MMRTTKWRELEARLSALESLVQFMATATRIRIIHPTGTLDAQGQPIGKVTEGTMLDFYHKQVAAATHDPHSDAS